MQIFASTGGRCPPQSKCQSNSRHNQSTSMKIPTSAVAVAMTTACVSPQQSLFASAFVPSSAKTGTRCASIVDANQNSHTVVRPASADESSATSTRRPEWSPSSWRDVKDDEVGAEEDESIAKAAKKISK